MIMAFVKKERKDVIGVKGKRSGRLSLRRADIMIIMTSISGGVSESHARNESQRQ